MIYTHESLVEEGKGHRNKERGIREKSTMFSGLTNQVSNWMGKKGEDGSELPPEEKIMSPGAEGDLDLEKKDSRYTKGVKI